jgi:hypothetical protein
MSVREIQLGPSGGRGFLLCLEKPNERTPMVYVFTEDYVKYILHGQNRIIADKLGIGYQVEGDPIKVVQWLHSVYMAQNWVDRTPHMVEMVDVLHDFKKNETNMEKAVTEVKKRYNLMFGSVLDPPYPELIPLPFPRVPLPASPFV